VAHRILYTEDALIDLEIILDYIRADNPSAAKRFGTALLNHVDLLESFPRIELRSRTARAFAKSLTRRCVCITGLPMTYD